MKPTLKNISKKANVSVATVSRILRKKNLKNKSNELKVLKIAREIGYPYIQLHRNKIEKKKIALIVKMESGEFYSSLFNGLSQANLKTDLQLNLISVKDDLQPLSEIISIINDFYASIIFLPHLSQSDYLSLCKCVDVLLDPMHFGAGYTFLLPTLVGTPTITMPGKYLRKNMVFFLTIFIGFFNLEL